MALICEPSAFIQTASDSISQLCLSPDPFDPSVFALLMAWPGDHHQPTPPASSGSSRGGNTPLSPLSYGGSSGGTPPSRLTPSSNESASALSAYSGHHTRLDDEARASAVAEFQPLHPSGRADDASLYTAYGYRTHAPMQNVEEASNGGLYAPQPAPYGSSAHTTPATLRATPGHSPQAPYFSSPDTLYPQQSLLGSPGHTYDPAAYGSLGGAAYSSGSGQLTPAMPYPFPHGTSTPSGESGNDPSPSPQSSGSDSPSFTGHSGSPSSLGRRRSSRGGNDANVAFLPPLAHIRKRPRRKAEEIERIYLCAFDGCQKSYGTLNHLNAHVRNAAHGEKRRPEEFRDIRNAWKRKKLEESQAMQQAEEQRQQASGSGPSGSRHSHSTHRRPTTSDYPQGFLAHREHHAGPTHGLGLPSMPQVIGTSRMAGAPGMAPQGYAGFPPMPSATGLSPYGQRGPAPGWNTDRPDILSPNHQTTYLDPQNPSQYFNPPIRPPAPPTGFNSIPQRSPQGMPEYQGQRQGPSSGYPPQPRPDQSRQ